MNQKSKTLLGLAAFCVLIVGAVFIYNILIERDNITPDNLLIADASEGQESPESQEPQEPQTPEPPQNQTQEYTQSQQVPNFIMLDAKDNEVQLFDFLGKPIVLNFWASWCPSCVREMPYFDSLYQELGDSVHIIKVNLIDGTRETRGTVDRFMYENGHIFPLYFDTYGAGAGAFGIQFIPITFFINENGYEVARIQGAASEQSLRQGVTAIMAD